MVPEAQERLALLGLGAWAIAAVHILGAGTDARSMWFLVPFSLALSVVATLALARVTGEDAERARTLHERLRA